ncbi:MAG: hypothetical protein ACD_44C00125G0009 [uncultured bacterium]|nr:MAG: hypothetical protein ACD_44C00125G0009 [uncultured bacterium]
MSIIQYANRRGAWLRNLNLDILKPILTFYGTSLATYHGTEKNKKQMATLKSTAKAFDMLISILKIRELRIGNYNILYMQCYYAVSFI